MEFDIDLFWDIHQQRRLNAHDQELAAASGRISEAKDDIRDLLIENHKLKVTLGAVVAALIKGGLTSAADFAGLIDEARRELRERGGAHMCAGCGRLLKTVNLRCLYCGEPDGTRAENPPA